MRRRFLIKNRELEDFIIRFYPAGNYTWVVPDGCFSVDVFLVGGGGSGSSAGGGGGYTKTFKSDSKGWKDGEAIAVKPGQSISITVGKGGAEVYQAEQNSPGKDGGYSQFMSSSYRANGGKGANKHKGSNRWKKAKHDVAVCHERIRNRRQDFLHKVSKKIVSENQTIIIEDLNVGGMLKNHCLAKGIASASWSEFFRMLQYKSDWRGVNLIRIGRFEPSSKMCGCGYIHRDLKLSDRVWTCPECGSVNDRDLLAANNIKRFGLEKKNLLTQENINKTPVVNREGGVELSALAGTVKRQNVLV